LYGRKPWTAGRAGRMNPMNAMTTLASLRTQPTVLLTTFRRDGTPVGTPVNIAVDGERAYFRTWDAAGKAKRLRRDPTVEIAPSTWNGRPTGPAMRARARLLDGAEAARAAALLAAKHPLLHGILVPLTHRLRRNRTVHYELTPLDGD
jgi:PPOX class probable F420-dependent enzyme